MPCCGRSAPAIRVKGLATGRVHLCCSKHRRQQYREAHPFAYAFDNLRKRARQRGHEFTLTLAEYTKLFTEAGAIPRDNKHAHGLSIDRRDGAHGYHAWNCQILPLGENSRKQFIDGARFAEAA